MLDPENSIKVRSVIGGPVAGHGSRAHQEAARMRAYCLHRNRSARRCWARSSRPDAGSSRNRSPPQQAMPERIVGLEAGSAQKWRACCRGSGRTGPREVASCATSAASTSNAQMTPVTFQPLTEIPVTDQDRFQQQRKFTYLDTSRRGRPSLSLPGDFLDPRRRTAATPPTRPRSPTSCPSRRRIPENFVVPAAQAAAVISRLTL